MQSERARAQMHECGHKRKQKHTGGRAQRAGTDTDTRRHADTQTHRRRDTQTHRHTHTRAHTDRHTYTQAQKHAGAQTHRRTSGTDTHTQMHARAGRTSCVSALCQPAGHHAPPWARTHLDGLALSRKHFWPQVDSCPLWLAPALCWSLSAARTGV